MIINLVQKNILINNVNQMYQDFGPNQKGSELLTIIDQTPAYKVETNGEIIVFYDLVDPDVFVFDSLDDFKNFIMREF